MRHGILPPSACLLLEISSEAICRVSSGVSERGPNGDRRPFTSIIGGLPGVKNKSLILGAARNIPASSDAVENGAGAGAGAAAVA